MKTIKTPIKLLISALLLLFVLDAKSQTEEINLSGKWRFQTDVMDFRRGSLSPRYNHQLQETIQLPGITDDYQIGYKVPYSYIDRLTRKYEYMGPAWYQRDIEIPADWKGKQVFLYFERTHWLSSIYVDTKEVSKIDYISVPHNHDLTAFLKPGKKHRITVCIDNRFQYKTHRWDHAHTEFTQINWNGILGEIKMVAVDPVTSKICRCIQISTKNRLGSKCKLKIIRISPFQASPLLTLQAKIMASIKC